MQDPGLDRRTFLAGSVGALGTQLGSTPASESSRVDRSAPFRLDYAPHFGMFKNLAGDDVIDQIKFMADQGFRSIEDNWMGRRDAATQEKIRKELDRLNMRMGVFVAHAEFRKESFTSTDPAVREKILADMRAAVQVAQRVGAKWCTVVPGGYNLGREWDYQTAAAIDNLRFAAEICEVGNLIMVLEALNPWRDHAGAFLTKIPQAYLLCRAADSPSCKILFDMYHQQVTEGNLIHNIDHAWNEIAYFQVGDHPGRKEPGTGEINYRNVFRHIHGKGFTGILGMEHGNSKGGAEGDQAVIDAYRAADAF